MGWNLTKLRPPPSVVRLRILGLALVGPESMEVYFTRVCHEIETEVILSCIKHITCHEAVNSISCWSRGNNSNNQVTRGVLVTKTGGEVCKG